MSRRSLDWDVDWHGERVEKTIDQASREALSAAGRQAVQDAQQSTPFRSGALRRSGRSDVVFPVAVVSFGMSGRTERGRETRNYAIPQHQRFDYKHPRGGGPQFLERSLHPGRKLFETMARILRRAHGR